MTLFNKCKYCKGLGFYTFPHDKNRNINIEYYCEKCNGQRLKEEALCVKVDNLNISNVTKKSIYDAKNWFKSLDKIQSLTYLSTGYPYPPDFTSTLARSSTNFKIAE